MNHIRRIAAQTLFGLALSASSVAHADGGQAATAEALFQAGQMAMEAGDYVAACPKFAESNRIEPGIGVLLYLADCYEKSGKIASAWATFHEAIPPARKEGQVDRERVAEGRAKALLPRLPRLVLRAATKLPPRTRIQSGDAILSEASLAIPIPVDPGAVAIEVSAPGFEPLRLSGLAEEGRTLELTIGELRATDAKSEPKEPAGQPASEGFHWNGYHTTATVLGGAGLAGLAVGAGFGATTFSTWGDAQARCRSLDDRLVCDAEGVRLAEDAEAFGWISTAGFVAGGSLGIASLALFLFAPSHEAAGEASLVPVVAVGDGHAWLGLKGQY